jgi:hypothetical protein
VRGEGNAGAYTLMLDGRYDLRALLLDHPFFYEVESSQEPLIFWERQRTGESCNF